MFYYRINSKLVAEELTKEVIETDNQPYYRQFEKKTKKSKRLKTMTKGVGRRWYV